MKKTLFTLIALIGLSSAYAADVTKDDFADNLSGTISLEEVATSFNSGTFAVSFEFDGSLHTGQAFTFTLGDNIDKAGHSYQISFECNAMLGILTFGGKDANGASATTKEYLWTVPDTQGPLLLQVKDTSAITLSYYDNGELTTLISLTTNGVLPEEIKLAKLILGSTTATSTASNIRIWEGEVTSTEMANPPAVTDKTVPEPATATLSLLALAALAARRRRR